MERGNRQNTIRFDDVAANARLTFSIGFTDRNLFPKRLPCRNASSFPNSEDMIGFDIFDRVDHATGPTNLQAIRLQRTGH